MKIRINKKAITLLVGATMVLVSQKDNAQIYNTSSIMKATTTVNVRLGASVLNPKIGLVKENENVVRILSIDNGWDIIKHNNKIGYVYSEYFNVEQNQDTNYIHKELNDLIYTVTDVNFRLEPDINSKKIDLILPNEELETIAYTQNGWYLAKYNNKIGYISSEYVVSLKEQICSLYPEIKNIEFEKYAYAITDVNVRNLPNTDCQILTVIDKYESFRILNEIDEWCLIKINDVVGYVNKNYIEKIVGTFITIDLSSQKIVFFKDDNILITSNVTTGKDETPTNIGLFSIYDKETNRYLIGEGYKSFVEYWMPFDGGIGLHDASWRKKFGGIIYKNNGSHGCVNLPSFVAEIIYNNINVGTKVLVHK